jgi:hypothetical protein
VLARFKVRIWEAEENLAELVAVEEVGQELHSIRAEDRYILVATCYGSGFRYIWHVWSRLYCGARRGRGLLLRSKREDLVGHELGHGYADFKTCSLSICVVGDIAGSRKEDIPSSSVSGIVGARANSKPPNPQPISATSTALLVFPSLLLYAG